jgi:hypothetical protein
MKQLHRILIILAPFLVSLAAKADLVTLRNLAGIEIRAEILSATDETVTLKRSGDGRTFTIGIKTLDEESIALVNKWKVADSKKPKKPMNFTIGNKVKPIEVALLVPEGEYNTTTHGNSTIRINFDTGQLQLYFVKGKQKTEETLKILKESREKHLGNLTPEERKKKEPLMKIVPVKYGEFDGYLTENNASFYGRFVDGSFILEVTFRADEGSPISKEGLPAIIGTIKVEDK